MEETLNRNAVYQLVQSISTTATNGLDFFIPTTSLTVPGDFVGEFVTCINFTIIGDNIFEGNETIVFDVVPQFVVDTVQFPENMSSVIVNILDNDGNYNTVNVIIMFSHVCMCIAMAHFCKYCQIVVLPA